MFSPKDVLDDCVLWVKTRGPWWAASVTGHALAIASLGLIAVTVTPPDTSQTPSFDEATLDTEIKDPPLDKFEVGETSIEPTELSTETLTLTEATSVAVEEQINGSPDEAFEERGGGSVDGDSALGGMGGFEVKALGSGPALKGAGGFGLGKGEGTGPGAGGPGSGFGGRGAGVRKAMLGTGGGTKQSERAVAAALNWIARHQNADGSWSIGDYQKRCTDPSCTGKGSAQSDAGATALCLLPFLAAGQTHQTKGPYKQAIQKGLYWLISQQKPDGNLAGNSGHIMYTHGLAAIVLCEAYALSYDKQIGAAAQASLNFIAKAQDPQGGGWRYKPLDPGDTSVVGWQVMALKSGMMAGLKVDYKVLEGAEKFLKSVSSGQKGGLFDYMPKTGPTASMSSVGLLCVQYLGAKRDDPRLIEGKNFLMANLPKREQPHIYYWYYATQVMHNMPGYEWDTWNRAMRKLLIETQVKDGCAAGSWDPKGHNHGEAGGRVFVTTLACLTLEVYYRYLPLYKLDGGAHKGPVENPLK
jgi:hypothetical protein